MRDDAKENVTQSVSICCKITIYKLRKVIFEIYDRPCKNKILKSTNLQLDYLGTLVCMCTLVLPE